jgi:hypothetical protein
VYPCSTRPFVSNVNYAAGERVANAVIVPVSAAGTVCFYALTPVDVVVDVDGWFAPGGGSHPTGPARLFDTRPGNSPDALRTVAKQRLSPSQVLEVKVTDLAGVTPATDVAAVTLNVTVDDSLAPGYVTVYPCGARPFTSTVNYQRRERQATAIVVPVSPSGTVCFASLTDTHLVVDIDGWFATTSDVVPVGPARVFDTRGPSESPNALRTVPAGKIGGATELRVQMTDLPGLVPADLVSSVAITVTVDDPDAPGFLTVYPCGTRPFVSNLNFVTDQFTTNTVLVPVAADGSVCFFSSTPTHVIADITAYVVAP